MGRSLSTLRCCKPRPVRDQHHPPSVFAGSPLCSPCPLSIHRRTHGTMIQVRQSLAVSPTDYSCETAIPDADWLPTTAPRCFPILDLRQKRPAAAGLPGSNHSRENVTGLINLFSKDCTGLTARVSVFSIACTNTSSASSPLLRRKRGGSTSLQPASSARWWPCWSSR